MQLQAGALHTEAFMAGEAGERGVKLIHSQEQRQLHFHGFSFMSHAFPEMEKRELLSVPSALP